MIFKSLRNLLLIIFSVVILASLSIVGTRANNDVDQPADPTPVVEKDNKQSHQPRLMVEQAFTPTEIGGPDAYGYEWNDSISYNWIPISGSSTEVIFPNDDDDVSDPIPLGLSFPFYEKIYSSVYISTNGLLTFVDDSRADSPSAELMPFIETPQALVAPFWDDLEISGINSKVYYQQLSSPSRFVVWYIDVTRYALDDDILTFQVILDANGKITYQYENLIYDNEGGPLNSATVGIEDHDGVVGLTYLHKSDMAGLLHKAVVFTRPINTDHRPKALPLYQGAFTVDGLLSFDLTITNAGDVTQSFDLVIQNSNLSWQIQLFDTANSLITETPVLAPGAEFSIKVKFIAPAGAAVGSTAVVNLSVKSSLDSSVIWAVKMQSTVPASFVQSVKDSGDIDLRAISKLGQREITVFPLYTGSTMGVLNLDEATFMNFWERNRDRDDGTTWSEIEQAVVNDFGADILNAASITNNEALASTTQYVFAEAPVSAITPDGNVGVAWIQRVTRTSDGKSKHNIYMAVLDADDTTVVIKPPFSVTQNVSWSYPAYSSPRITATPNNTFFISWTEKTETESNIGIASYTSSGNPLLGAQLYSGLSSVPDVTLYDFSTVYGLANNHIVLGYSSYDKTAKIHTPGYAIVNTSGGTISSPVLLTGVEGTYPIVSQLANGFIVYAWTKTETDNGTTASSQIAYVLINPASYIASTHLELTAPDGLQGDYVSITPDEHGNAIFTWMDTDIERKLYYALIDGSGSLVTPPMSFYEVESGRALQINEVGKGNAFYIYRFGIYLPIIVR